MIRRTVIGLTALAAALLTPVPAQAAQHDDPPVGGLRRRAPEPVRP